MLTIAEHAVETERPSRPAVVEPLSLGPIRLRGRAILAPMAGITDLGMRRLAWRFGAALTVTEMVAGEHLLQGDRASLARARGEGDAAACRADRGMQRRPDGRDGPFR